MLSPIDVVFRSCMSKTRLISSTWVECFIVLASYQRRKAVICHLSFWGDVATAGPFRGSGAQGLLVSYSKLLTSLYVCAMSSLGAAGLSASLTQRPFST